MAVAAHDPSVTTADLDTADRLGIQLGRLARALGRSKLRQDPDVPSGVERSAIGMLGRLVQDGPQRTGKLAELLDAEPSTISRQTRSLVSHGLVERRADPVDGRVCVLAATDAGARLFEATRRRRNLRLAGLLSGWPEQDRRTFTDLLERLISSVETTTTA
ncbi:MarR family winged helix-turn-helix transcriptional regulator [Nocardia sp. alder85J]|uniref:MarR family winged helix-turn-helix transcriptional regulator n=1 Tax=Nocardia sp. alder85J TaxID=2862949 RepID=UPI001CD4BBAB|nr:MarR family transcriptional regulator [Nocardia sp. alder85J]MCX4095263.1 MarR family transcriptional regulator [Nocardia sp. alder85J]